MKSGEKICSIEGVTFKVSVVRFDDGREATLHSLVLSIDGKEVKNSRMGRAIARKVLNEDN